MRTPPRRRPVVAGQKARLRRGPVPTESALEVPPDAAPLADPSVEPLAPAAEPAAAEPASPSAGPQSPTATALTEAPVGARQPGYGVLSAVLVVLIALLASAGWLIGLPTHRDDAQPRLDALAAARVASVDLLSVNFETLEAGKKKAAAHLAPKFRGEYTKFFTDLQTTALKNKLVLTSSVVAGGVTSVKDSSHVVVLLFIDQISTNAVRSSPRIDQNRVRLRMVKLGGQWLVEGLDAI